MAKMPDLIVIVSFRSVHHHVVQLFFHLRKDAHGLLRLVELSPSEL